MTLLMRISALLLVLATMFNPARADFDVGLEAYTVGDFDKAAQQWMPLAEAGDKAAQYHIGLLYEEGQSLEQNYDLARYWYLRAATAGFTDAYFALGEMYAKGRGTVPDRSLAYHWYSMAADQNHSRAKEIVGRYAPKLSNEQMAEARRIYQAWHVAHVH